MEASSDVSAILSPYEHEGALVFVGDNKLHESLASLELQIGQNPYDKGVFEFAISLMSNRIDIPDLALKLSSYRQQYMHRFSTKSSFWVSWLSDEMILTSASSVPPTNGSKSNSSSSMGASQSSCDNHDGRKLWDLFDLALDRCPTLDIVLTFVEYSKQLLEEDLSTEVDHRKRLEKAVSIIGGDIFTGLIVWKALIEFECDELEDLVEINSSVTDIQAAKKNISQLCHKMLSNPLANLDEALQFASEVFESVMLETDEKLIQPGLIQKKYEASKEAREARLTFENHIHDDATFALKSEADRCKTWLAYVEFEVKDGNLTRARRIFDRAMYDCDTSVDLRTAYLHFARYEVKNWSLVKSVAERSFAICYNSLKFWKLHLIALEILKEDFSVVSCLFDQAVCSGLASASDYLTIFLMKCDYINRYVIQSCQKIEPSAYNADEDLAVITTSLEVLKTSFQQIETFLDSYYSTWLQGWVTYVSHRVQTEHFLITEIGKSLLLGDSSSNSNSDSSSSNSGGRRAGGESSVSRLNLGIGSVGDIKNVFESLLTRFPREMLVWKLYIEWSKEKEPPSSTRKIFKRASNQVIVEGDLDAIYSDWLQFESIFGVVSDILSVSDKIDAISDKREREVEKERALLAATTAKSSAQSGELSKRKLTSEDSRSTENKKAKDGATAGGKIAGASPSISSQSTTSSDSKSASVRDNSSNNSVADNSMSVDGSSSNSNSSSITNNSTSVHSGAPNPAAPYFPPNPNSGVKLADADRHFTVFVNKLGKTVNAEDLRSYFAACGEILALKINVDKLTGESNGNGLVQFVVLEGRQAALKLCNKVKDKEGNSIVVQPSKFPVMLPKAANTADNYHKSNSNSNSNSNRTSENINATVNLIKNSIGQDGSKCSSSAAGTRPNPYLSNGGDEIAAGAAPLASKPKLGTMFKPRSVSLQAANPPEGKKM